MGLESRDALSYDEKRDGEQKLSKRLQNRETAWRDLNMITHDGEKKREELKETLKDAQKRLGFDESKYLKQLDNCQSNGEIFRLEGKFKKAAVKWYEVQLKKSGLYEAMHDKERPYVKQEFDSLMDHFMGLKLGGTGYNMVDCLDQLKNTLRERKQFRDKLGGKSKFIREEYFRRLGSLPLYGSKEKLLKEVVKNLKEVEDSPSAIQYEFRKKQKKAKSTKKTAELKKELHAEYDKKLGKYTGEILKNQEYFGGKKVNTPFGKIPLTAWEFIQWFQERGSFADMDSATKKLPSLIKDRKRLYEKRDEILQHALPKDRERLEEKTKLMRRHELKAYLPELEKNIKKNNVHVAEYMGTIITARARGVNLFLPFERAMNIRKFKLASLDSQKSRLKILHEDIADRERVVREYFNLPSYLRNDPKFIQANHFDREKMLLDAKEQLNREKDHPFDISTEDELDSEDVFDLSQQLKGYEGEQMMDKIEKEMEQEGLMKAAEIQNQTYWKIFGAAKRAEMHNETQKESYLRDLKFWIRLDQHVEDETDVRTERQRAKYRFIEAADEAYELGYTITSGGEVGELQEINQNQLKTGGADLDEKLGRAKYGEHVRIMREDGQETWDPLEMIEKMSETEMMKLVMIAINKLGRKHMGMSAGNVAMLRNSQNIQKEMSQKLIDREFSHLKKAA